MPERSTNDPSYATSSSEISELLYLRSDEKSSDNCPYQNDSSDPKKEKMKFNPQWLEKYSLFAV